MEQQLTADDARKSLAAHVESKGIEIFTQYGAGLDWDGLQRLLQDRAHVRYPCEIVFDEAELYPGEFAHPVQNGERPEDGFKMHVHPVFLTQPDLVPALVLYQLVALNYGVFASFEDAETFGAAALGLTRDEYYEKLCGASDQIGGTVEAMGSSEPSGCSCGGGGDGCGGH